MKIILSVIATLIFACCSLAQTKPEDFKAITQMDDGALVGIDFKDAKTVKDQTVFAGIVYHNDDNYTITIFSTNCTDLVMVLGDRGFASGKEFKRTFAEPKPTKIPEKTLIEYAVHQVCGQRT